MQYWKKVEIENHFLFSKEITKAYNILSPNEKYHYSLCSLILRSYYSNNDKEDLYYCTLNGMVQVFEPEAIKYMLNILLESKGKIKIGNKNYSYTFSDYHERMWINAIKAIS